MTKLVLSTAVCGFIAATAACSGSGSASISPAGPSSSGISAQQFAAGTSTVVALSHGEHNDIEDHKGQQDKSELEGRITSIDTANKNFVVRSTTVHVPADAVIRHGHAALSFADLHVGDRVHVKGSQNGTTLVASLVIFQNDDNEDDADESEVEGIVSALGPACPTITFMIGSVPVATSDATTFRGTTCAQVANNIKVEVRGTRQANGTLLASRVSVSHDDEDDD